MDIEKILAFIIEQINGRKAAVWGVNAKTKIVVDRLAENQIPTIIVDTNFREFPEEMEINDPEQLRGKSDEYFVFVITGTFHQEIKDALHEMGFGKRDYIFRAHEPISVSSNRGGYYKDRFGNEVIGRIPEHCEIWFHSWMSKVILGAGLIFKGKGKLVLGCQAELVIGDESCFGVFNEITVRNQGRIEIGNRCRIYENSVLVCNKGSRLKIGDDFISGSYLWMVARDQGIEIGKGCLFSQRVVVQSNDAHPVYDLASGKVVNRNFNTPAKVVLEDYVWIGVNASVFGDSKIGSHSVIGANSMVKQKIFPAHCIAAGTPAKIIRENITWSPQFISAEERESSEYFL